MPNFWGFEAKELIRAAIEGYEVKAMYKVIIVDDEPHVCQLIRLLVDWNALNIQVVGVANSGKDAYAMILEQQPDIVITDIRMPGIDGLELVRITKELNIPTQFIIISGYRHFEYAHNALRYDVRDYLLKPIKKAELEDCLRKICVRLSEKKELEHAEELINLSRSSLHRHFLHSLYQQPAFLTQQNKEQLIAQYQLPFSSGLYQIAIFRLDDKTKISDIQQRNTLLSAAIGTVLPNMNSAAFIRSIDSSCILLLLNYRQEDTLQVKQELSDYYRGLSKYISRFDGMVLTGAVGPTEERFESLPLQMDGVVSMIRQRVVLGTGMIYHATTLKTLPLSAILNAEQEQRLHTIITTLSEDDFYHWFKQEEACFRNIHYADPNVLWALFNRILQSIFHVFPTSDEQKQTLHNARKSLDEAFSLEDLCKQMADIFLAFFAQQKQSQSQHVHLSVNLAKKYISENYMNQIRLDDIASHVHMNASYFSTLFKKETGLTVTDYLSAYRIDVAKSLLKNSGKSIAQIGDAVGYADAKYFTKSFTKEVGISPTQYRRLYL